jgi:protein-S-isoprenylcysteine O-methyltransferase Ste14
MATQPTATKKQGFFYKPVIEQLKLIALFAVIGALVYSSKPTPTSFAVGAVLVTIGAFIRVWAGGHLTRDQKLTTSGPYQYTRNPFYLGRLFLIIGFAIMSGLSNDFSKTYNIVIWAILLGALAFFFLGYMPRKEKREGGRLKEMFGPDYEVWKSNVPQLFPRLTPYVMNPRPWSRELFMGGDDQYTGNKELWTTIATFVLVGLVFLRMQM